MEKNNKELIKEYLQRNSRNYRKIFYNTNLNNFMKYASKILERKLLDINHFCYFLNYILYHSFENFHIYLNLSKNQRKQFNFYHKSIIKIYMHLDCIFNELDNIKEIPKKNTE